MNNKTKIAKTVLFAITIIGVVCSIGTIGGWLYATRMSQLSNYPELSILHHHYFLERTLTYGGIALIFLGIAFICLSKEKSEEEK